MWNMKGKCCMKLSRDEKVELARHRMAKAASLLADGETLLRASSFASSSNRSYYAALSAARALLVIRGTDPESHEGVKVLLSREYIRTGILARGAAETFRVLQARRMDSDYGDFIEIGTDEATDSLARARQFVEQAGAALETLLRDMRQE
jgi:uncharacterized protein (UPF0332 family)